MPDENRLEKYKEEVERLRTALDLAFGVETMNNPSMPEDIVVFPLGVAARDIFEEINFLAYYGFGHAALRSSRTLYECVVFALYISKHPETWKDYLATMHAQWAKILQNLPEAERTLPEMHNELLNKVPKYRAGKYIPLDWNEEGTTYNMASDVGISREFHSLAFGYTSAFVHPSSMFFLQRLSQSSQENRLIIGPNPSDQEWRMAMQVAHDLIINAIRLRQKYSRSPALKESLVVCEADFLNIWGYVPQLTQS